MKRIRTAWELYSEMLKSFYFGVYQKNDRFMTYQEMHETYNLSKDTIARAYAMLRGDGFIHTAGTNGTIVTFDVNNPEHVAKVPIEWPRAVPEDSISYEIAMELHAHSLYTGLIHSSAMQLQEYKERVEDILERARKESPYHEQVLAFWTSVISSLSNQFLDRITDHFISRYFYLLPPAYLSPMQRRLLGDGVLEYYEFLLDAIECREFKEFPAQFAQYYHNYYQYGGVVFSRLEDGAILKEQALYRKLLDDIYIKILSQELQKGDALPTTKQLCAKYSISTTTANRVYGILAEMGFISRRVRSGTTLIAGPDDVEMWQKLEKVASVYERDWKDAIDVLFIINSVLSRRIAIAPDVVQQMQEELIRQHNLFTNYATPYFASAVLFSPLIASLPAGILHKYYIHLWDALNKVITLCMFRVQRGAEAGKEIYHLMCNALDALERGDQSSFADLSECAMRKNVALLTADYTNITRGIATGKRHINNNKRPVNNNHI